MDGRYRVDDLMERTRSTTLLRASVAISWNLMPIPGEQVY